MAAKKEISGAISSFSYGYKVKVLINGIDVGITGGKSESKRLFVQGSSLTAKAPAEMKKLFCLKEGENAIVVEFAKTSQGENDKAEVSLTVDGKEKPLFFLQESKASGKVEKKIEIKG